MNKPILVASFAALAAVSLGVALLSAPADTAAQTAVVAAEPVALAPNPWVREPVLMYDISGSTLAGPFHRRLSVYNDGLATFSTVTLFPAQNEAAFTFVSVQAVKALADALNTAGAASLPDKPGFATDSPLTTVTFFRSPAPRATANTFSWWFPSGAYTTVSQIIEDFIDETFNAS